MPQLSKRKQCKEKFDLRVVSNVKASSKEKLFMFSKQNLLTFYKPRQKGFANSSLTQTLF